MKTKITLKKIFFVAIIACALIIFKAQVSATTLSSNELLNFKDFTIKKDTKIDQIINIYGQPKITTSSAFGGNEYSFYDDEYSWYLGIETNSNGKIMAYGCINGDFTSKYHTYGEEYNYRLYPLGGTVMYDRHGQTIYGVYEYNCTTSDVSSYWSNYMSNSEYLYNIQKHAVIVSKVIAKIHGDDFVQTYISEDLFYSNELLKSNGTDLYNYAINNGKSKYVSLTMSGYEDFYAELPNPVMLGKNTEYYTKAENYKYIFYDINLKSTTQATVTTVFVDPEFTSTKETVSLTDREITLLNAVKEQYALYNEHGSQIPSDIYDETPQYTTLPLTAGKWNKMALYMATDYLNIARAGLGINILTLNDEIAECAQYKATLIYYMNNNGMKDQAGHFPTQPDGVSDEFYNKAQSYMNENLYSGNIQTSIVSALNDSYGDATACGHRYNLLDPTYTEWGVGAVGSGISWGWQAAHKFGGYSKSNTDLVAWPSNGIFPLDLVYNGIGNWTAKFYNNSYKVSSKTEVSIKCLNNGKTYEITNSNKNESGKYLATTGTTLVTFRDDSISYESGDVFEITLKNVTDSSGNTTNYTYRSVFLSLYDIDKVSISELSVDEDSLQILVGETEKLNVTILPDNATNKMLKFVSSNENVAKVRQDGTIIANSAGRTKITVYSLDGSQVEKTISVTVKKDENDPDYLKGDLDDNGVINSNDAAIALDLYKYGGADDIDLLIGDMDDNGILNANDASLILDIYKYGQ